jgi:hypothetical protein
MSQGEKSPVVCTLSNHQEVKTWYLSLLSFDNLNCNGNKKLAKLLHNPITNSDVNNSSPETKISRKDKHFLNTLIKISNTLDTNMIHSSKERDEKEPGFARLEQHKKNMILNASTTPPFKIQADSPAEFYSSFLSKKRQLKAKDMLTHRFLIDKISFNPSASFTNYLWSGDFFWILQDSLLGVSIFYCLESKSLNTFELEKERAFTLADKIKQGDIEKMTKQKLYLQTSVMDMVWMTQNLHATICTKTGSCIQGCRLQTQLF